VKSLYARSVIVFGALAVVLGIAILAETARAGGGSVGYTFGALFLLLGCGRLYLAGRR
jgi:hypothetical protein